MEPQPLIDSGVNPTTNVSPENSLSDVQNRIFHAMFYRLSILYARVVPVYIRRVHEFCVLCCALLSLFTIIYLRVFMIKMNPNCLSQLKGSLSDMMVYRIEIIHDRPPRPPYFLQQKSFMPIVESNQMCPSNVTVQDISSSTRGVYYVWDIFYYIFDGLFKSDRFVLEFAYQYGFLRLSDEMRENLKIPVLVVEVDFMDTNCFGNAYWQFILRELLGYQDVLLSNIKNILGDQKRGYARNVINGESFRFVATWVTKLSFLAAFTVMIIFTVSISILLRYCHNQIFFFIVELLHMFEINVIIVGSPIGPFITSILALIGIETIMSEFFNDSSTAFCIIVLVWMADQFYNVCCRTSISRKYWVRYFYLYQFVFYAYYVRFNGQYSGLALFCTYSFVVHSMLYFLNHYELPYLISRTQLSSRSNTDTNENVT